MVLDMPLMNGRRSSSAPGYDEVRRRVVVAVMSPRGLDLTLGTGQDAMMDILDSLRDLDVEERAVWALDILGRYAPEDAARDPFDRPGFAFSPRERQVLNRLYRAQGEVVSYEMLALSAQLGTSDIEAIRALLKRMRAKLPPAARDAFVVCRGIGMAFRPDQAFWEAGHRGPPRTSKTPGPGERRRA